LPDLWILALTLALGCTRPGAVASDAEPPAPETPAPETPATEDAVKLSDLTPARLVMNEPVALPETDLTVTLLDYRYNRKRDGKLSAWASVRIARGEEQVDLDRWEFSETREVLGHRLHLRGSRSEVLVYALPEVD